MGRIRAPWIVCLRFPIAVGFALSVCSGQISAKPVTSSGHSVRRIFYEVSPGSSPVRIFGHLEHGRHGNFINICADPAWLRMGILETDRLTNDLIFFTPAECSLPQASVRNANPALVGAQHRQPRL